MSLINDAIKQAHKTNKERQANEAPTTPGAGMQSANTRPAPATSGSTAGMLIIAGIVVFVLLGGALLFLSLRNSPLTTNLDDAATTTTEPPATPVASSPAPEPQPAAEATLPRVDPTTSALNNPVPPPATQPAPAVADASPAPATPAGPRPFPELKLQGIYYRLKDPSVMISGKTLMIGDLIGDVKVIKIDRKEVTLELDSQQKVLRLQ